MRADAGVGWTLRSQAEEPSSLSSHPPAFIQPHCNQYFIPTRRWTRKDSLTPENLVPAEVGQVDDLLVLRKLVVLQLPAAVAPDGGAKAAPRSPRPGGPVLAGDGVADAVLDAEGGGHVDQHALLHVVEGVCEHLAGGSAPDGDLVEVLERALAAVEVLPGGIARV